MHFFLIIASTSLPMEREEDSIQFMFKALKNCLQIDYRKIHDVRSR